MRGFKNIGIILSLVCFMSGCASFQNTARPLPKCNGYSERPLNKPMWNWEGKNPSSTPIMINNDTSVKSSVQNDSFDMALAEKSKHHEIESYKNCG
ncbi:type IV secretion protein VblB7 [Bartonella schoenbuchensis]